MKDTLHYNRRLIKMFYDNLSILYTRKEIPIEYFDYIFDLKTLKIIPRVLVPMEKALSKSNDQVIINENNDLPMKLYNAIKKGNHPEIRKENFFLLKACKKWLIIGTILIMVSATASHATVFFIPEKFSLNALLQWSILMYIGIIMIGIILYLKKDA